MQGHALKEFQRRKDIKCPQGNKLKIRVPHIIHEIKPRHLAKHKKNESSVGYNYSERGLWGTWLHTSNVMQMDVPQLNTTQKSSFFSTETFR